MIVEYVINEDPDLSQAHIRDYEVFSGKPVIYLGGSLELMTDVLKNEPYRIPDERVRGIDSWEDYFEAHCERLITHEFLHIIIFGITNSPQTCRDFDNIERERKDISSCGLEFAFGDKV